MSLGSLDTLRVSLTAQEGRSAKRAHQVFLLLKDPETGLDVSYPFGVKENGKSKVDLVSGSWIGLLWLNGKGTDKRRLKKTYRSNSSRSSSRLMPGCLLVPLGARQHTMRLRSSCRLTATRTSPCRRWT